MSVETNLKQEKIMYLDLSEFCSVGSGTSVRDTVAAMRAGKTNAAFILKDGELVGIFTDRDVLHKVVQHPEIWDDPIDEHMTGTPSTLSPEDSAKSALQLMDEGHFRNVPVVDSAGKIHGNVSHYAFIKFLADGFPQEVYNLPPDDGIHDDRYGG